MRKDMRTLVLLGLVIMAVSLVMVGRRERTGGGTGGGGTPTYPEFVERTHPIEPIDLGAGYCEFCSYPALPTDPVAVRQDTGLDGRIVAKGPNQKTGTLEVTAYAGGPVLYDPQPPDPAKQLTYRPETPQAIPRGQDCLFWFSPYMQLTLRWDYRTVANAHRSHIIVTGHWYRKTYAR